MADVLFPESNLINVSVIVDGKVLPDSILVISVYTEAGFNLIPMLQLGLTGPSDPMGTSIAPWLDDLGLKSGSTIEVKAGYDNELTTIFKGNFMGLTMGLDDEQGLIVEIDAISPVFALDLDMDVHFHEQISAKELCKELIMEEGFALKEDLDDSPADDVYFEGTAWELLVELAAEHNRIVLVNDKTIQIVQPTTQGSSVGILEVGNNILDMELTLDAFSTDEKERFGEIAIPGTTVVGLNDYVTLKASGKVFDGDALVVSITHDLAEGQWETVVGVSRYEG